MLRKRRIGRRLSQSRINGLNFLLAITALLLSLPSVANQLIQFERERRAFEDTVVLYYSPPTSSYIDTNWVIKEAMGEGRCQNSNISGRTDAYRCFANNAVLDPCFYTYDISHIKGPMFYCPKHFLQSTEDKLVFTPKEDIELHKMSEESSSNEKMPPWLITLDDGVECWLTSGAVGIAYGDKGNVYFCSGERYHSVTDGDIDDNKYFFECRLKNETVFKKCYAKQVVF